MAKLFEKEQDLWNGAYTVLFLSLVAGFLYYMDAHDRSGERIPFFDLTIIILAIFRLIRLFTYDTVTGFLRRYLENFQKGPMKTAYDLINCPWCAGMWMSLFTVFIYFAFPWAWHFLLVLSLAGVGSAIQIMMWRVGLEPPAQKK